MGENSENTKKSTEIKVAKKSTGGSAGARTAKTSVASTKAAKSAGKSSGAKIANKSSNAKVGSKSSTAKVASASAKSTSANSKSAIKASSVKAAANKSTAKTASSKTANAKSATAAKSASKLASAKSASKSSNTNVTSKSASTAGNKPSVRMTSKLSTAKAMDKQTAISAKTPSQASAKIGSATKTVSNAAKATTKPVATKNLSSAKGAVSRNIRVVGKPTAKAQLAHKNEIQPTRTEKSKGGLPTIEKQVKLGGTPVSVSVPNQGEKLNDGMNINLTINLAAEEKKRRTTTKSQPAKKPTKQPTNSPTKQPLPTPPVIIKKEKNRGSFFWSAIILILLLSIFAAILIPSCHNSKDDNEQSTPLWEISADGKYMYFGNYPQRLATDAELATIDPLTTDSNGYYADADGNKYKKLTATPYDADARYSNGTIIENDTYYFKIEKIKWRILRKENNTALLLSDSILDAHQYGSNQSADIGVWLNATFITNFTASEQSIILSGTDTSNKVFLINKEALVNADWFDADGHSPSLKREKQTTDYARASSARFVSAGTGWWLYSNGDNLGYVDYSGYVYDNNDINLSTGGIAPLITIDLSANNNLATYTVKHYKQKLGNWDSIDNLTAANCTLELEYKTGKPNARVAPSTKHYDGFTAPSAKTITINKNGSTVVEYYYTRNSYTLTIDKDNGTKTATATGTGFTAGVAQYGATIDLTAQMEDGYTFLNWTGYKTIAEKDASFVVDTVPDNGVIALMANSTGKTYKLTFDGNATQDDTLDTPDDKDVVFDTSVGILPTATRDGYTLEGWYTDEGCTDKITEDTIFNDTRFTIDHENANQEITLYAKWTENVYHIAFNGNGADNGSMGDITSIAYTYNQTLPTNTFTRVGYTFLGWATNQDAQSATYTDGQSVTKLTPENNATATLYAVWTAKTYTITFNGNAEDDTILISATSATAAYSSTVGSLPTATRTSYEFDGWYNNAACSTKINTTTIINDTNFTINHTAQTITVYAKWIACVYGDDWESDGNGHWKVCSNCNGESAHVAHTFKNGICDICAFEREELAFSYDETTESYMVTGIGRITGTDIVIPATYDDGTNGSHPVKSVDEYAFFNNSTITSVTFSANMETIGEAAFGGCSSLSSVTFSNTIKKIDQIAFALCESLTNITLPNGLLEIGLLAFGMSGLTSINIPATVETIGYNPFATCDSLTSIAVDSTNPHFHVTTNCLIDTVNKKLITGLSSATIPSDSSEVTIIGDGAFYGCTGLTTITIPNNITEMEAEVFADCSNLTFAQLPNALETIASTTFLDCSALTTVVIPASVTTIEQYAFGGTGLTTIYYGGTSETNWNTITIDNGNSVLDAATIYYYSTNEPTTTGKYWHYVEGVATPWAEKMTYTVKHYGEKLDDTYQLMDTEEDLIGTIDSTVTATPKTYAGFTHITIEDLSRESGKVARDGSLELIVYYSRNDYILTLNKGENIASVGVSGAYVTADAEIAGEYTVKYEARIAINATPEVGYTFSGWTGYTLTSSIFTMPAEAVSVTATATPNTYTITFNANSAGDTVSITQESKNVTYDSQIGALPTATRNNYEFEGWFVEMSGTTEITAATVLNGTNFATIDHTNKVLTVYAKWTACVYGEDWEYDETNHWKVCSNCNGQTAHVAHTFKNGICDVCEYARDELAFSYDGDTNSYTVTGIGRIKGTDIVIPATYDDGNPEHGERPVKSVEMGAFASLYGSSPLNITSVTFSENMETIGEGAFLGCESLTTVTLSSTIKEIGEHAFSVTGLTSINIPASVETIGDNPFLLCGSLTAITVDSANTKFHVNNSCLIDTINKKIITGLSYANIPSDSGEITKIGYGAFGDISGGTTLKIPSNITGIDTFAFSECASIVSVELPIAITIQSSAFLNCPNLTTIYYAGGSQSDWTNNVTLYTADNTDLTNATRYYYSENEPTTTGKYWHYVDSVATPWAEKMTYTVEHHIEKLNGSFEVASAETENKIGNINSTATATAKTITGFTHTIIEGSSKESGTITADGNLTLRVYYTRNSYTLTLTKGTGISSVSASGDGVTSNSGTYTIKYGATVTLTATASAGYTFNNFTSSDVTISSNSYTHNTAENVSITANATAKTNTAYSVEYYLQNLAGNDYIKDTTKTVNTTGTTDTAIDFNTYKTAIAGFEFDHSDQPSATINGNGNTVVKLYYTRKSFTLTLTKGTNVDTISATGTYVTANTDNYTVKYGASVTLSATANAGYTFSSWTGYTVTDNSFTMPAENVSITASATANTNTPYTVKYYMQNIADNYFTEDTSRTVNATGTTGTTATITAEYITGFTFDSAKSSNSGTITGDGRLELKLYYNRRVGQLFITKGTGIASVTATGDSVVKLNETDSRVDYNVRYGAEVTLTATASDGYTFSGWTVASGSTATITDNKLIQNTANVINITANATAKTNTPYKVEHWQEELAGGTYIVAETENLTGTTGTTVTATAKTDYDYFTHDTSNTEEESNTIKGDGTLTLKVYYKRKTGTLLIEKDTGIDTVSASGTGVTATATYTKYSVKYGATVTLTATASTGYTLAGWGKGSVILSGNTYTHNALEIMVTAKATANTYNLTYNTNGGNTISSVSKSYNTTFTSSELPTPTKTGYTFEGWYNDSSFTTKVEVGDAFTTTKATFANVATASTTATIHAKWTENTYTISFNGNGNTSGTMSNITDVDYTEEKTLPTNTFVKTGYVFLGWSTVQSAVTESYSDGATVSKLTATNNATIVLYAIWAISGIDEPYTRVDEDGNPSDTGNYVLFGHYPQTVATSTELASITATNQTDTDGYHLDADGNRYKKFNANPYISSNTDIHAKFGNGEIITSGTAYYFKIEPIKWRILTTNNGKAYLLAEDILYAHRYYETADSTRKQSATSMRLIDANDYKSSEIRAWLNGYSYTGESGTVSTYLNTGFLQTAFTTAESNIIQSTSITENSSTMSDKVFLIKYDDLLNTSYGFPSTTYQDATRVKQSTDYSVANYLLASDGFGAAWWWTRTKYQTTSDTKLYYVSRSGNLDYGIDVDDKSIGVVPAIWIDLGSAYRLTYETNGGNSLPIVVKSYNSAYKTSELPTPTKTGYTFVGWYKDSSFTTEVEIGDLFTTDTATFTSYGTPNTTATIYAKWTENTYTIAFNNNGGTGEMASLTGVTYTENKTLTTNTFTKTGCAFVGWSKDPNATTATYENGATVTGLTAENGATVTLYAIWHEHNYSWDYNSTNHWQVCSVCDATTNTGTHSYGADGLCTTCGRSQLEIEYNTETETYTVTGVGDFTGTTLAIPSTYNDGTNGKKSVTSIDYNAFKDEDSITSVSIPASITNINSGAFMDCSGLTSLTVDEDNSVYHSINNCIIETATKTLWVGSNNATIPTDSSEVTSIGDAAFSDRVLTSITIPSNITSIGAYAFCLVNLETSLTIPGNVETVGPNAFSYCEITSLTLQEGVKTLQLQAFFLCEKLESISLPASLESMSGNVFSHSSRLAEITLAEGNTKFVCINNCLIKTATKTLVTGCKNSIIPTDANVVTSIGNQAFYGANIHSSSTNVKSITIPANITSISSEAFSLSGFESIVFAENSSLNSLGNYCFSNCQYLTSFTIPDGVTTIGYRCFLNCYSLTTLVIPTSVTSIGSNLLQNVTTASIYYAGTQAEWDEMTVASDNTNLNNATKYYYSENEPTATGNYWHYVDGVPTQW